MKPTFVQLLVPALLLGCLAGCSSHARVPELWKKEWHSPSALYRPLQIVHGTDLRGRALYYKDSCGLGGVVCNVPFGENYLKSEADWQMFVDGVKEGLAHGLRVWIYDEDGYPSLGAGGRVLEADSSLLAMEMVYDPTNNPKLEVRPSYEFTHSSNNFYVARRYPNPLDPRSTQKFIELTHQAYLNRLGPELYTQVEAFFTDEPSLMAVNTGELREDVQQSVRVVDPLDKKKKNLPMISWVDNLPQLYKESYGEELSPQLLSLFTGEQEADKAVRQKFWALLARLDKAYYYDAIADWCRKTNLRLGGKGPVTSGHGLREESPMNHVPLDGNKLLTMLGYDIPGLDQLNSDPNIWQSAAWMAAVFPGSAAYLNGTRRVMCEMSDFDQTLNGHNPVTVEQMQAATAWQMALGVTDFTLYYTITYGDKYPHRNEQAHRRYCDFVGRINALTMEASPVRDILLYYPIYDLQREFIPVAGIVNAKSQNERCQSLERSFRQLGSHLLKSQNPFVLIDYLLLSEAQINPDGSLQLGGNRFRAIVLPAGVTLPESAKNLLASAQSKGLVVVEGGNYPETPSPDQLTALLNNQSPIMPLGESVAYGKFERDGKIIHLMVNTGTEHYKGVLTGTGKNSYQELNPGTGTWIEREASDNGEAAIALASWETKLIVVEKQP